MEEQAMSEAQEVAKKERKARPVYPSDKAPRFATHVNWNRSSDLELFYCAAFRKMPFGYAKRVVVRFMDMLLPEDCRDPEEAARLMVEFLRAPEGQARAALLGGVPTSWGEHVPRMTVEGAREQRRISRRSVGASIGSNADVQTIKGMLRRMQVLLENGETQPEPEPEPEPEAAWEEHEVQLSRAYPEPAETPPPQVMARKPAQTSMMGLMGGRR